jgi:hypothetical protein
MNCLQLGCCVLQITQYANSEAGFFLHLGPNLMADVVRPTFSLERISSRRPVVPLQRENGHKSKDTASRVELVRSARRTSKMKWGDSGKQTCTVGKRRQQASLPPGKPATEMMNLTAKLVDGPRARCATSVGDKTRGSSSSGHLPTPAHHRCAPRPPTATFFSSPRQGGGRLG